MAVEAVCSHGYAITVDVKPEHLMEKVLYAGKTILAMRSCEEEVSDFFIH